MFRHAFAHMEFVEVWLGQLGWLGKLGWLGVFQADTAGELKHYLDSNQRCSDSWQERD